MNVATAYQSVKFESGKFSDLKKALIYVAEDVSECDLRTKYGKTRLLEIAEQYLYEEERENRIQANIEDFERDLELEDDEDEIDEQLFGEYLEEVGYDEPAKPFVIDDNEDYYKEIKKVDNYEIYKIRMIASYLDIDNPWVTDKNLLIHAIEQKVSNFKDNNSRCRLNEFVSELPDESRRITMMEEFCANEISDFNLSITERLQSFNFLLIRLFPTEIKRLVRDLNLNLQDSLWGNQQAINAVALDNKEAFDRIAKRLAICYQTAPSNI